MQGAAGRVRGAHSSVQEGHAQHVPERMQGAVKCGGGEGGEAGTWAYITASGGPAVCSSRGSYPLSSAPP